jgi:hypothetical protein
MSPEQPYLDEAGDPQLCDSMVLFADLLGTRGRRSREDALRHLLAVRGAVKDARAASFASPGSRYWDGINFWFSDNFCIAYPIAGQHATSRLEQLVIEAGYLHIAFINADLCARGAITRGDFFADGDFVYGPALERAVALEHARAVYARTVLDEASIETAHYGLTIEDASARGSTWRQHLLVDNAGVVFVDYLGIARSDPASYGIDAAGFFDKHRQFVREHLNGFDGIPGIEEKYRWLGHYHDYAVAEAGMSCFVKGPPRTAMFHSFPGDGAERPSQRHSNVAASSTASD